MLGVMLGCEPCGDGNHGEREQGAWLKWALAVVDATQGSHVDEETR